MAALSRRQFLAGAGALVVSFRLYPIKAQPPGGGALPRFLAAYPEVDSWLRIGADDAITIMTGKVELGQGLKTALLQIAAEELEVAPSDIAVITADTEYAPNEAYTAGSRSIEDSGMTIRRAAAEMRQLLLELASERFGVPAAQLRISDGVISHNGGSVRYSELVGDRTINRRVSAETPLKAPASYRHVGQSWPRVDLPAKVFGGEAFIQDLRPQGMLHARTVHPPRPGSVLQNFDRAGAEAMPGVVAVIRDGSFLAVVAEREEHAINAAARLSAGAVWQDTHGHDVPDGEALESYLREQPAEQSVVTENGTAGNAATRVRATYLRPFQAHASIGPSCAIAQWNNGALRLWTHSQGIFPLREDMARVLKIPEDAMHVTFVENAGCYGHNGADDAALEAALIARALPGRPVRLQWSRADEFGWEPLGAAMLMDCDAGLDDTGSVTDWQFTVRGFPHPGRPGFGAGDGANLLAAQLIEDALPPRRSGNAGLARNAVPLYRFPAVRVDEHFIPDSPTRVSSLRALGAYANVFALESFIDELAAAAGRDPVEFRLAHLDDPRAREVIAEAARLADWSARDSLPDGRALGMGFARYNNTAAYCAVVVDAQVQSDGAVRIHHLWSTVDCGQAINPDGVRNQIEGGAVQSISWTLLEAMSLQRRNRGNLTWQDYPILRYNAVPDTRIVVLDRPELPPLGTGEASQGPAAAAVANAVFAATGARVRQLPLTPERVTAARGSA
jgi:nicotinate dehydrogenase subunit B